MSPQVDFAMRFQRLLALLRYAAARGDEGVSYSELATEFGLDDKSLVAELETAAMIGAEEADYDAMPFEVVLDDDRVSVRLFSLDRPLRLTPGEALSVVASAEALVSAEPADTPLRSALAKVAAVVGLAPGESIDVDTDPDGGAAGRLLREAIAQRRCVGFRYWSYIRDEVAERTVHPWSVLRSSGSWYLFARDRDSGAERSFRLDRMAEIEVLDEPADALPRGADPRVGAPEPGPTVTLVLPLEGRWVPDYVPALRTESVDDGRLLVELAVADRAWLERLLLRIGPGAEVVRIDPALGAVDVLAGAARRILRRYREHDST